MRLAIRATRADGTARCHKQDLCQGVAQQMLTARTAAHESGPIFTEMDEELADGAGTGPIPNARNSPS